MPLFMALPQVHEQTKRHQPEFILGQMKLADAEIEKPGKQLIVAYSAAVFFESGSLSTFRFVPLNIASMMASL